MSMELLQIFDRPISYPRCFATIAGVSGAIMLSHALCCLKYEPCPNGWLSKTSANWAFETGLTSFEQKAAKRKLKALGILEEKDNDFFRINMQCLHNALTLMAPHDLDEWEEI